MVSADQANYKTVCMAAELTLPETLSRASPEGELQTSADSGPLETIELVQC